MTAEWGEKWGLPDPLPRKPRVISGREATPEEVAEILEKQANCEHAFKFMGGVLMEGVEPGPKRHFCIKCGKVVPSSEVWGE